MAGEFTKRELFGGAIEAEIPDLFVDASQFRPVPDSQEVFVSNSDATDISIVVDILQRVNRPDVEACQIHFDDVIDGRDSVGKLFQVEGPSPDFPKFGPTIPIWLVQGTIASSYFPAPPPTDPTYLEVQKGLPYTFIFMAIIRLEAQKTDLVITINCPVTKPEEIINEKRVCHPAYNQPPEGVVGQGISSLDDTITLFKRFAGTLEVRDWNLFSPED